MSIRLEVQGHSTASPESVWEVLVDWAGQDRWIPFTTVRVTTMALTGLGVRCDALSGVWVGQVPVGLLDRFVVTAWTPPGDQPGELEILHLGPYFTGPGVFRLSRDPDGTTTISCTEVFDLPLAPLTEPVARLSLPLMRAGFRTSLGQLARLAEGRG